MKISVSEARSCLGQLCARAQDPRQPIVLTRHGRDIAALVSMEEVARIWRLQQEEWRGPCNPLTGRPRGASLILPQGMTVGAGGKIVTQREAAEEVRRTQKARADERRMLEAGGLAPVEGGELMVEGGVEDGGDGGVNPALQDAAVDSEQPVQLAGKLIAALRAARVRGGKLLAVFQQRATFTPDTPSPAPIPRRTGRSCR